MQDPHGKIQHFHEEFLCKNTGLLPRKAVFLHPHCVINEYSTRLLNFMTTNYLLATERNIFPDFFKSSQQPVLCAFPFPISFPPLCYHVHMDRQSNFTIPPYIPKEQLTYATCGQPI